MIGEEIETWKIMLAAVKKEKLMGSATAHNCIVEFEIEWGPDHLEYPSLNLEYTFTPGFRGTREIPPDPPEVDITSITMDGGTVVSQALYDKVINIFNEEQWLYEKLCENAEEDLYNEM